MRMSVSPSRSRSKSWSKRSRSRSHSPQHRRHSSRRHHKHHRHHDRSPGVSDHYDREHRRKEREYDEEDYRRSRSGSRDRDYRERDHKDKYHRDRDYDSYKEHRSSRISSSSSSRWEREERHRDRYRDRDYDRDYDRDSDDSERSSGGGVIGASGSEIIGFKSQPPNNTIMIRGLAQHITENDIRQDIINCGLMPRDIRLIRKKDTGASRGFAFVEFSTLNEATRWMEMKQGILMLQDQYRAIMQYSIPKELCPTSEKAPTHKASADWFCIKCGAQNFKRRELCFKCHASRMESEEGGSGSDEICSYTTKTIMLRNLDALTTEDTVMSVLNTIIPDLVKKISAVAIGRDPLTSTSRGICYLGTETTIDALSLFGALNGISTPLTIDNKTVILSYCKYNMGDSKHVYAEPEPAITAVPTVAYTLADVDSLADFAAQKYAKTPLEYQHYLLYYKTYFTQQINNGESISLHQENQMDAANAAAAVAQSAIQQVNANKTFFDTTHMAVPSGTDGKRYPMPDASKYTYDNASGYYYDASTGLYYDPNSQYYYNSVIQKYLYWDREKLTYVLAPSSYDGTYPLNCQQPEEASSQNISKKTTKVEKQDKVKVAKKIAKDMERWAKTLNQKKDTAPSKLFENQFASSTIGSADIGFSVLEKNVNHVNGYTDTVEPDAVPKEVPSQTPLVAAYGGESESSDEEDVGSEYLDFSTLICNLCKRMLASAEALAKHAKLSAIHKQNLENLKMNKRRKANDGSSNAEKIVYRDRAKERRLKYGDPDEPTPSKLKEKFLKSREMDIPVQTAASVLEPISSENVGNKLLQKMGWSEGQGLGKSNQGRTNIIQAEQRVSSAGLGTKSSTYSAIAGESYKDCVKKMMYARYQELSDKES